MGLTVPTGKEAAEHASRQVRAGLANADLIENSNFEAKMARFWLRPRGNVNSGIRR